MERARAPAALLAGTVLLLYTLWSGSFIAFEALLTSEAGRPAFDWLSLTVARYVPVAVLASLYCALFRRREAARLLRARWRRLAISGTMMVPVYCFALYGSMQQHVAAPIGSLITTLAPLFVMLLSALFLGERITRRRAAGFFLALAGMVLVARARDAGGVVAYPALIALGAIAPLAWAVHTVVAKPAVAEVSPLLYTYLALAIGGLPLLLVLPFSGLPEMLSLPAGGWAAIGYLSVGCNLVGYAIWTWLLVHLPATTVGFTVFLNPPMTTGEKLALAALLPAAFRFSLTAGEAVGAALTLIGVGVAVLGRGTRSG